MIRFERWLDDTDVPSWVLGAWAAGALACMFTLTLHLVTQ